MVKKRNKFFHKVVVMDASVLIKPFLMEEGYEQINELIAMHLDHELTILATPLLVFEFLNVISRAVEKDKVKSAYLEFKGLGIGIIKPDDKFVYNAIEKVSSNHKISYYDASYHALAKDMDGVFLTADKKYYELMKKEGNVELIPEGKC